MYLAKSIWTASPTVWPERLVAPPRGRTGTRCFEQSWSSDLTSPWCLGMTAPIGSICQTEASVE